MRSCEPCADTRLRLTPREGEEPARGTDGGWFGQLNQGALAGRREQPSIRPHRSKRPHPKLAQTLAKCLGAFRGIGST